MSGSITPGLNAPTVPPVTGLTLSTAYWLDVSLAAITGGTATVTGVSITAIELPCACIRLTVPKS